MAVAGFLSVTRLARSPYVPREWGVPGADPLLQAFTRWDWQWYGQIAAQGYSYGGAGQSSTAFFPLFPLLARVTALGSAEPVALAIAGVLVANAALLLGLVHLVALVREEFDARTASRAALYVLVFPTTLFLSAAYADSLFFALAVASLYHARHGRWWLAGVLGGLAALDRPHGVLLVLPLALEYALQRWRAGGAGDRPPGASRLARLALRLDRQVLALALVPAGLAAYVGYLWLRFGDPLAFVKTQAGWGRTFTPIWETFARFFSTPLTFNSGEHALLDLAFALLFAMLAIVSWRVVRPSYALFVSVMVLAVLSAGNLLSVGRFGVTFFPALIVLAVAGRDRVFHYGYLAVSSVIALYFMALFAQWYWVA